MLEWENVRFTSFSNIIIRKIRQWARFSGDSLCAPACGFSPTTTQKLDAFCVTASTFGVLPYLWGFDVGVGLGEEHMEGLESVVWLKEVGVLASSFRASPARFLPSPKSRFANLWLE